VSSAIIHIREGKITNNQVIAKLFHDATDGRYLVELKKRNHRTLNQNDYYWLIMTDYVQPGLYDAGWNTIKSKEDAHEFCKELFLKVKEENEKTGEVRTRIKSTTELTTIEFNTYLEEIWAWAAEYLNITIPSPNQKLELWA
jgi:hypothetical protein